MMMTGMFCSRQSLTLADQSTDQNRAQNTGRDGVIVNTEDYMAAKSSRQAGKMSNPRCT